FYSSLTLFFVNLCQDKSNLTSSTRVSEKLCALCGCTLRPPRLNFGGSPWLKDIAEGNQQNIYEFFNKTK
ncbi:hypothetical protein, partial [Daejeonella sp.]|uniref:hypothetical protein n=1 Tax=Daejeonella sp. TaxID=2805397 RepID=UPI0030BBFEFD